MDTWIFYEICGDSLGSNLYEMKGEDLENGERVYRIHYRSLYLSFKKNISQIKKLLLELSKVLDLLVKERIVHSDLKTENILIKQDRSTGWPMIKEIKLIDYGSSFPFDDLKQFSMATPEYMAPEILNYILLENNMTHCP